MSSSPSKGKKARVKPPKGRPIGTSAISHPVVEDASTLTTLSSFSPRADLFAFLSLSVDKHRLRVYDTTTGRAVAETIISSARVTASTWCAFRQPGDQLPPTDDAEGIRPNKKRRKQRSSYAGNADTTEILAEQEVVLGLSDGTLLFFSPSHARVLRTLSHPSSSSPILSIAIREDELNFQSIWTSSADGNIRLWDTQKNGVTANWKCDDRIPYSSLVFRPAPAEEGRVDLLAANHGIHLLSLPLSTSDDSKMSGSQKMKKLASCTGHASSVMSLKWDHAHRFLSIAEADRHVHVWEFPEQGSSSSDGTLVASIPLDSDARNISLLTPSSSTEKVQQRTLLTLSSSGKISIFSIPTKIPAPAGTKQKVSTFEPLSNIIVSSKRNAGSVETIDASFMAGEHGRIHVARLVGGVRLVFHIVPYLDESGNIKESVNVVSDDSALEPAEQIGTNGALNKRYTEPSSIAVASGVDLGQDPAMDDLALRDIDGDLDVNLAELSLGQRLTALSGVDDTGGRGTSSSDSENPAPESGSVAGSKLKPRKKDDPFHLVPANSLTRTLIQALHSSDSRLLETCLAHSDQTLIRNTVQRLPPQLAVPLLNSCVERLGRGPRASNMKGGGGGASSQRGMAMITWVKAVLTIHSGHLMTMPDLVARLSGLHATLTTRLTLHESLLSLNGRLDMVLSQIEMRSSIAPAPLAARKNKSNRTNADKLEVRRYVEGESEDENENEGMEVEVESNDDAGSVEDVELGGESSEEEDEESEESEDDEEDDGSPVMNGFIDDEAEEFEEDEDEDYSE